MELLAREFGDRATEVVTKLGASNEHLDGVKCQLLELEQKMARRGVGGARSEPEKDGQAVHRKSRSQVFL